MNVVWTIGVAMRVETNQARENGFDLTTSDWLKNKPIRFDWLHHHQHHHLFAFILQQIKKRK